jgi:hypothetical protein
MPRPSPRSTAPDAGASADRGARHAVVAVPRAWLVLLTVLGIAPWVAFALLQIRSDAPAAASSGAAAAAPALGRSGPWGQLEVTPITIAPPIEYVPTTWGGPPHPSAWTFPGLSGEQAESVLVSAGLSREDAARLRAAALPNHELAGVSFAPDPAFVRGLASDVRGRVYKTLGRAAVTVDRDRAPINFDQLTAYRYHGRTADDWLGGLVSPATRRLIDPLVYRDGDFLYFADIELVRPAITDAEELQRLARALMRQETVIVRARVDAPSNLDSIAEYWGRGGRRTDIRPILESVVRNSAVLDDPSRAIDIGHLLPAIARQLLYRYPRVTPQDLQRPLLANCLWTALNFFNLEPDSRHLDVGFALETLRNDYFIVHDGFQLGDIVAFRDPRGNLVHVAVYLADDLVFSKNGASALAPWSILPMADLAGHYSEYADSWLVSYHRRNGL